MTRTQDITDFQGADFIDVRDVIARVEELREDRDGETHWDAETAEELKMLEALLTDLCGNGGDEQWEGEWYPVTLIRDSHFNDAMDEMLEDCGDIPKDLPCYLSITVDYKALQMDYSSTEFDGVTYWYR